MLGFVDKLIDSLPDMMIEHEYYSHTFSDGTVTLQINSWNYYNEADNDAPRVVGSSNCTSDMGIELTLFIDRANITRKLSQSEIERISNAAIDMVEDDVNNKMEKWLC
jgi:hypothetical protein